MHNRISTYDDGWVPPAASRCCADTKRQHVVNDQRRVLFHRMNFRSSNCANCDADVITHQRGDSDHYLSGWYTPPVIQEEPV